MRESAEAIVGAGVGATVGARADVENRLRGAGVGAGFAGYGAGAASLANTANVGFDKSKADIMGDIYDPKFGKGQATTEKLALESDIDLDIDALRMYEESGALDQILYENIGKSSSYIGATSV